MRKRIKVGAIVRVKQGGNRLSSTRYEVVRVDPGHACVIREWPEHAPESKTMPTQSFDTSLLRATGNIKNDK